MTLKRNFIEKISVGTGMIALQPSVFAFENQATEKLGVALVGQGLPQFKPTKDFASKIVIKSGFHRAIAFKLIPNNYERVFRY